MANPAPMGNPAPPFVSSLKPFAAGPTIAYTGEQRVEGLPGSTVTLVFRALSPGQALSSLRGVAALPAGWTAVALDTGRVDLHEDEVELLLVVLSVPANAPPGPRSVEYTLLQGGTTIAAGSYVVVVPSQRKIGLRLLDAPVMSIAGAPLLARFLATNEGNAPLEIRWQAKAQPRLPLEVSDAKGLLQPGEARVIEVHGTPPTGDASIVGRHRIELLADAEGMERGSAMAVVEVVPAGATGASVVRAFPLEIKLRTVGFDPRSASLEIGGAAAISEDGRSFLSVMARGPRTSSPFVGNAEEYRVSLETPRFGARGGDQVFRLSSLTEAGRYGFGAGGWLRAGALTLTAFGAGDRHGADSPSGGAQIALSDGRIGRLEGNFLHKENGNVSSVRGVGSASDLANVEVEYGRSWSPGAPSTQAVSLRLYGSSPLVTYEASRLDGDVGYIGGYGGILQHVASLQITPGSALTLGGMYNARQQRDSAQSGSTSQSRLMRASATYGLFGVEWDRGELARGSGVGMSDRDRNVGRIRMGLQWGLLSVRGWVARGTVHDRANGLTASTTGLSGAVSIRSRGGYALSFDAEQWLGPSLYSPWTSSAARSGSASATFPFSKTTRLQLFLQASLPTDTATTRGAVDASLTQGLPRGHALTLRVRSVGALDATLVRNASVGLEYSIALGIPYGRTGSSGEVQGLMRDGESGLPVAGALVRLGTLAVSTGKDGRYTFRGVPEGVHYVDVDRGSLGAGRILLQSLPLAVTVGAGAQRVDLVVTRGARLGGTLSLDLGDAALPEGQNAEGRPSSVLLELTHGSETVRLVAKVGESFEFVPLAPGDWSLRVIAPTLPASQQVVQERGTFTLAAGSHTLTRLRIVPRVRPIRMLPGGDIDGRGSPKPPAR